MLQNEPVDISKDFSHLQNEIYVAGSVTQFNAETGEGLLQWQYHKWVTDWAFNTGGTHLKKTEQKEIFWKEHEVHPVLNFSINFINSKTIRLRIKTKKIFTQKAPSLMLVDEPVADNSWGTKKTENEVTYTSNHGSIKLQKERWKLSIYNADGKLLTETLALDLLDVQHPKSMPFSFVKRIEDNSQSIAASFSSSPNEKIYGCGESFTELNKSGQKIILYTTDTQSAATQKMYKPIPFFFSNKGYGMFIHTSTPVTLDFGFTHSGSNTIYVGEDELDLFIFLGSPKEILYEYTALTGRSPLPPLWSFGLWMSRLSYRSQQEVENVAHRLRENKIPCDVIHIDAGWFKDGFNCDWSFNEETFPSPGKMIQHLKENGFKVSLWQLPYITSSNDLFNEVIEKNLCVKDEHGNVPDEDAVLDFSNPETQAWYEEKIKSLLQIGIAAIKADFGEAAPYKGLYHSSAEDMQTKVCRHPPGVQTPVSGFYEHNLYPLRYNKILHDITYDVNAEHIIWARSAWAGSQRYPVHWSGDPEVSDIGMTGTLRAGLSLGLSGFSFWSHDIGGFFSAPKEELFKRWAFFGMFSSHSRVHGLPPREPWEFSEDFLQTFRFIAETRYRLMPYIYSQAALCTQQGLPLLRALLLEYPNDPNAWMLEDEYLFGNNILIAPLMEENAINRNVYLPEGKWVDYQTKQVYQGNNWQMIEAGKLPGIIMIKYNSIIPHIALAQSTAFMNWEDIQLVVYGDEEASGIFYDDVMKEFVKLKAKDTLDKRFTLYNYDSWQKQ